MSPALPVHCGPTSPCLVFEIRPGGVLGRVGSVGIRSTRRLGGVDRRAGLSIIRRHANRLVRSGPGRVGWISRQGGSCSQKHGRKAKTAIFTFIGISLVLSKMA